MTRTLILFPLLDPGTVTAEESDLDTFGTVKSLFLLLIQ